jgi:hypothetical protein
LPPAARLAAGAVTLLMVIGGGIAVISALVEDEPQRAPAMAARPTGVPALGQAGVAQSGPPDQLTPAVTPGDPAPRAGAPVAIPPGMSRLSGEADRRAPREPRDPPAAAQAPVVVRTLGVQAAPAPAKPAPPPVTVAPAAPAPAAPTPAAPAPTATVAAAPVAPVHEAPPAPVITKRTVKVNRSIPFRTRTVRDPDLDWGEREVETRGVAGVRTLSYQVRYRDGKEISRRLIDSSVTRQPQSQVVALGGWGGWPDDDRSGHDDDRGRDGDCGLLVDVCLSIARGSLCPEDRDPRSRGKDQDIAIAPADVAGLERHREGACN